ncbi:MAG TPA: rRNA maturation RNase YbeY [Candidatus Methylomirabilis sp.]|nr:rRNA maturation RNase YbeY [Candidatus Methylomirabilis sp.]
MIEINNRTKYRVNARLIKRIVNKFLAARGWRKKDVSLAFVGDARMRELNRRYRKKDCPTDVLSFAEEGTNKQELGEIIIDPAQIKRQAPENGNSFPQELIFILVHGLLHLAGYDDRTEKERLEMIKIGEEFIRKLAGRSKK